MSTLELTDQQVDAARALRDARPEVLPGTNVIADTRSRFAWYASVTETMRVHGVSEELVPRFCGIAGVPD